MISGVSLWSSAVMRLEEERPAEEETSEEGEGPLSVDLLLRRRSLYRLAGDSRWHFTHQILKDQESFFRGQHVPRQRRVSIICRNVPDINPADIFKFQPIPES